MTPTRRTPELRTPGHSRNIDLDADAHDSTGAPRPVVEIRDELVEIAREAWLAGEVVDPHRLSRLADELAWAASFARLFGGDPLATNRLETAVRETAELAQLLRRNAREAA
jgi:hypothetical protein